MEYTELNEDQRRDMLKARVLQLESEHYQHTLNLAALDAPGDLHDDPGRVANRKTTRDAIEAIEAAHNLAVAELRKFKPAK